MGSPQDAASEAVCGAVVSYFGESKVCGLLSTTVDTTTTKRHQRSTTFWLFAAACYVGDVELASRALSYQAAGTEDDSNQRKTSLNCIDTDGWEGSIPEKMKDAFDTCLSIAAQEGRVHMIRYLLDRGFDINATSPRDCAALLAAVESRRVDALEVLIDPSQALQYSGTQYERSTISAAFTNDDSLRWRILTLLTKNTCYSLSQVARDNIFDFAAEIGHLALAKWAMTHGPVDIFNSTQELTIKARPTPLSNAVHGPNMDIFRLMIHNMDNTEMFVPAPDDHRHQAFIYAHTQTLRHNKLEAFLSLVKIQPNMTPERAFVEAGMVEGASSLVEATMGKIAIHTASNPSQNLSHTARWTLGSSIGEEALYLGVGMLQPRNIRYLLERGCRLRQDTKLRPKFSARNRAMTNPELVKEIVDLLAEYGCRLLLT